MRPHNFESIIASAGRDGWDFFKNVDPNVKTALDVNQSKNTLDAKTIASAWARFARSPDGRKAMEQLFDTTLRRTVFFVQLGLDPASMATFGSFREGQNALAHEIARQIGIGNQERVKPRDT